MGQEAGAGEAQVGGLNFRHRFAYRDVMMIKRHMHKLTDWEIEFVTDILERGLLDEHQCSLKDGQFRKLQEIAMEVVKRR